MLSPKENYNEEKNFIKASNHAHITQQSLSEPIKLLEGNFQIQLFLRLH